MFVGTHKNKKKKIEKTIGSKRSRVGTNRRWLKMTRTNKEKIEKKISFTILVGVLVFRIWCENYFW